MRVISHIWQSNIDWNCFLILKVLPWKSDIGPLHSQKLQETPEEEQMPHETHAQRHKADWHQQQQPQQQRLQGQAVS